MIAGLVFANVDIHAYEEMVDFHIFGDEAKIFGKSVTVHFLINEIFMVFFFGIATKEITESVLPGGALNPIRKALNPLMGTLSLDGHSWRCLWTGGDVLSIGMDILWWVW